MLTLGPAASFGLTPVFLSRSTDEAGITDMEQALKGIIYTQNTIFVVVFLSFILFFKNKPDQPPSAVAEEPEKIFNFFNTFTLMWQDSNFGLLALANAIKTGLLNNFGMLLSDLLSPYDYSPEFISMLGLISVISGVMGAVIVMIYVDKTRRYKSTVLTAITSVGISLTLLLVKIHDPFSFLFFFAMIITSAGSVAFIPLMFNFAAEITFPAMPGQITGGL